MTQKLSADLEKALLYLHRYGLKPSMKDLEELIKQDLVESIDVDDGGYLKKAELI